MARFLKHLFFCVNERKPDDPRGCCTRRGSGDLLDYAKMRIHEMGLKGKVRVNKTGCLDACQHGPSLVIYPDATWYRPRSREDVEEILTEHIAQDRIVERLVIPFKTSAKY